MASKTIEPSDVNYYDELPQRRPVAQARKKLNFRFILTEIDKPLFVLIMLLLMFGMVMMFSASYGWSLAESGSGTTYLKKQAMVFWNR